MEMTYRLAKLKDLDKIMALMESTAAGMANKALFVADDLLTVKKHMGTEGEILLACPKGDGAVAAFLIVRYPRMNGDNLGWDIGMDVSKLCRVAHMESVAVSRDFRGLGMMKELIRRGEALAKANGCCYSMCTVSPDNPWSLNNMLACGYEIVATVPKYGGVMRHILKKCL